MKSFLHRADIEPAANGDKEAQRRVLIGLHDAIEHISTAVGVEIAFAFDDKSTKSSIKPPSAPIWTVVGVDGKFVIDIQPSGQQQPITPLVYQRSFIPRGNVLGRDLAFSSRDRNVQRTQVLYQLQSALNTNFDNAAGVTSYGPKPDVHWEIQDPNVSKYWRLRTRYITSDWSGWFNYVDATLCGVVAIASGVQRAWASAKNMVTNSTNFATVDSIDAGASATVRIYGTGGVGTSWTRPETNAAGIRVDSVYPAGTITGLAYSTTYLILFDPQLNAYVNVFGYPGSVPDRYVFAGKVQTVAAGGGGGVTGGGGSTAGFSGGHLLRT